MEASAGSKDGIGKMLARARRLMDASNYDEAISTLQQALIIDPNNTKILEGMLVCNLELKRPKQALRTIEDIVRLEPQSRSMWADKGYLHLLLNENREGIEAIQNSLKLNPYNGRLWQLLGFAYMTEERWSLALEAFQKSQHFTPSSAEIWYNCAVCLFFMDDFESAIAYAEQAFSVDPLLEDLSEGWVEELRESLDDVESYDFDPADEAAS